MSDCSSKDSNSVQSTDPDHVTADQDLNAENTEESAHHFLKRWQKWDLYKGWVPFDPNNIKREPPRADLDNYFYLNIRYKDDSEAELVLSHFSVTLIDYLRFAIGNEFFDSKPESSLKSFFSKIDLLKLHLEDVREVLASGKTGTEIMEKAKAFGRTDAVSAGKTAEDARIYLQDLVEHLGILLELVEEEFKGTAERLATQLSYGHISFDLLIYYFKKGRKYYGLSGGDPIAFELTNTYYDCTDEYFTIIGKGLYWDGDAYVDDNQTFYIYDYVGTKALTDLTCKVLTDDIHEKLVARGKRYAALSGVHYMACDGHRIVVDRKAYDLHGGYTRPPEPGEIPKIDDVDLDLLPPRVYGFDLQTKSWQTFHVDTIGPITFDEKAWDHLVLDEDTKVLIKGLVNVTKNSNTSKKIIADVITGKGGGLIAVLHGPPGTGKTLTAEAVAEHLQRPLYTINSLQLSTDQSTLESNLTDILKLATAWDAVLLIDEADVFLEQRSLHDLQRNALVSVALRVLEYHRGVLFLTTNRIQTFDDAFLSRFSIAIKYPELDEPARLTIWRKFFELAGLPLWGSSDDFVRLDGHEPQCYVSLADLEQLAQKKFNGRTIKNLVRTAQALSLSLDEPLSVEHVKVVVRAQEKFLTEFAEIRRN